MTDTPQTYLMELTDETEVRRSDAKIQRLDLELQKAKEESERSHAAALAQRYKLEVVEFIAFICGADISPPPPIPTIWHTDRSSMRQFLLLSIMDYEKSRNVSREESIAQRLIKNLTAMLRW